MPKSYSTLTGWIISPTKSHINILVPRYLRMELYLEIGFLQIELDGVIQEKREPLTQCEWCSYIEGNLETDATSGDQGRNRLNL